MQDESVKIGHIISEYYMRIHSEFIPYLGHILMFALDDMRKLSDMWQHNHQKK